MHNNFRFGGLVLETLVYLVWCVIITVHVTRKNCEIISNYIENFALLRADATQQSIHTSLLRLACPPLSVAMKYIVVHSLFLHTCLAVSFCMPNEHPHAPLRQTTFSGSMVT